MTLLANRFRIIETLGQGAMGAVYRVADTLQQDREIALKLIHTGSSITPEQRLRFKEEFRAMTRLRHPNTIAVYDYGQLDEQNRYLTMEIVEGPELAAIIPNGGLEPARVYPLVIQLLQALGFIHARHYVHRDVKAANIRVVGGLDGTLKLMDFGMMIQLGGSNEGGMTGTPGYMAPEVIAGGAVTAATDLYSVGCLLFELVTGRLPFVGRLLDVVRGHCNEPAPSMRLFRAEVPPGLEAIVAKLLDKDPRNRYQDAASVVADLAALAGLAIARPNQDQRQSYLVSAELVGRSRELAELAGALEDAKAGDPGAYFVGAPAGVGKTRLVQEIALQAKLEDLTVLQCQGRESGMAPFEALTQALRPLLARTSASTLDRHGPVLARIFPDLQAWGHRRLGTSELGSDKLRLHEALAAWLADIARGGTLVWCFDDLQWSDPFSLEAFNALIRALAVPGSGHRILLLGTLRSDETPPGSPVWFTVEEGVTRLLKLGAFGPDQVRGLITAMLRDVQLPDAVLDGLYGATAGNAFFVTEALRDLMEREVLSRENGRWTFREDLGLDLLPSVEATIGRRLAGLDDGTRELAGVAAVLGRTPDRATLLAVSGLDEETMFARLETLMDRQFILRDGARLSFPHDRVRDALYLTMPAARVRELHQRCGEFLESRASGRSASAAELAYHFARGTDRERAFRYLRQAGEEADAAGVEAVALDYWRQADEALAEIDLPDKVERQRALWWDIGFAAFVLYPRVATGALERLCDSLDGAPEARERLHAAMTMLSVAHGFAGQPAVGLAKAERALTLADGPDTPTAGATLVPRTASLMAAGRIDELVRTARRARELLAGDLSGEPPSTRVAVVGAVGVQNAVAFQGVQPDDELRDVALREAAAQGDPEPFTVMLHFGVWYAWTGREAEALSYLEATAQKCRRIGAPPYIWALYVRPYVLWQRGEVAEALALVERSKRYPHLEQSDFPLQLLRVLEGHLHLDLGDHAAARAAFTAAESRGRTNEMWIVVMRALLGLAALGIASGDFEASRQAVEEVKRLATAPDTRNALHMALAHRVAGELAIARNRPAEARPQLMAALGVVVSPDQDNLIEQAHVHRALGRLAAAEGRASDAARAYARAGALYNQLRNAHHLYITSRLAEALQGLETTKIVPKPRPAQPRSTMGSVEGQYESLQRLLEGVRGHLEQ